jgi:hypothetical protein
MASMAVPVTSSHRHRLSLPQEPGRRAAAQSLMMTAATVAATVVAGIVGTFLQFVVFDLEEQELLSEAGVWGYVAGLFLLALIVVPAVVGIELGRRARSLGERRLGTTGIVANALIVVYLGFTAVATLLFG